MVSAGSAVLEAEGAVRGLKGTGATLALSSRETGACGLKLMDLLRSQQVENSLCGQG